MILAAQLAREAGDDFVLHAEKVGEGSVKAVGPQTRAASTSCALFTRPSGIVETDSVTACASSSLFAATFGLLFLVVLRDSNLGPPQVQASRVGGAPASGSTGPSTDARFQLDPALDRRWFT
jgi:hypothetical protein